MLIISAVNLLFKVLFYMLFGRAILSWIINPYNANPNGFLPKLNYLLVNLTEPIVRPFRALLSRYNTGPADFSIFVAMIGLMILRYIFVKLLVIVLL